MITTWTRSVGAFLLGALLATSGSVLAQITVPTTFTANTTILSSEVNSNFSTLGTNALNRTGGTITGVILVDTAGSLTFEGATADAFELTLGVADVTADVTATIPGGGNAAYAFVPSTLTTNDVDVAASVWLISGGVVAEGATANTFETTVSFTDPTADRAITVPDAAGEISLLGQSIALASEVTGTLPVANGGTGLTAGTSGGILGYTATGTLASSAALTANAILLGGGAGATPTSLGAATNGQIPIGSTGAAPVIAAITAGSNITVTNGAGTITIASTASGPITGYAATLADVANTITETTVLSFTVPANAWADGDIIYVYMSALAKNNKGTAGTVTAKVNVGAGAQVTILNAFSWSDSVTESPSGGFAFALIRRGATTDIFSAVRWFMTAAPGPVFGATEGYTPTGQSTPTNFTADNVVSLKITLSAADATFYFKPQTARVHRIAAS